jgi:glycosyltransferase involved in cell wall biosynthesis
MDRSMEARHSRLRILFNGLHSKSGGGVTYLRNMVPLMADDPTIDLHLCLHEDQAGLLSDGFEGVTVHFLRFRSGFWRLLIQEQLMVPGLAKRIGADVTFSPANYGPILAPNSVILLRNALSVAFVERRPSMLAYWALLYLATALSLLFSRGAIAVSDYALTAAGGGLIKLIRRPITVVPHGVSGDFSPPEKDASRDGFLLAVSDIYVQKNLENLIAALARLRPDHPDLTLKIAGRPVDGAYFERLKRRATEAGLQGNIEFLGELTTVDLVTLYRYCRVFVFPSTIETFGNPLVEAMTCGAPVACSNAAAMPEIAGDGAIFFDPDDVGDMADVIRRFLEDGALGREMSEKALARARRFSWRRTAAETIAVLKSAAERTADR